MANVNGVLQVEMRGQCRQVIGIVIHVVTVAHLSGPAMPSAVMSFAGVACRRRQRKYESPQSTPVAAAQPHASGPSPTERWAMSAEPRVMAKPAYAHSLSRAGTGESSSTTPGSVAHEV